MKRMTLVAAALAACSWMGATVATAAPAIVITEAPPAPRVEVVPAPRANRVWVEGHYAWRGGQYAWVPGHWQGSRRGMQWEQARWEQRPDGSWVFVEGHWRRGGGQQYGSYRGDGQQYGWGRADNDGDGVRNRDDRFPNNPNRS